MDYRNRVYQSMCGKAVYLIAVGVAQRPNFSGYSYIDEMIGDAILNVLMYLYNYDPYKYNNPFGYITFVIWRAFQRRIKKEHRNAKLKTKLAEKMSVNHEGFSQQDGDSGVYSEKTLQTFVDYDK